MSSRSARGMPLKWRSAMLEGRSSPSPSSRTSRWPTAPAARRYRTTTSLKHASWSSTRRNSWRSTARALGKARLSVRRSTTTRASCFSVVDPMARSRRTARRSLTAAWAAMLTLLRLGAAGSPACGMGGGAGAERPRKVSSATRARHSGCSSRKLTSSSSCRRRGGEGWRAV